MGHLPTINKVRIWLQGRRGKGLCSWMGSAEGLLCLWKYFVYNCALQSLAALWDISGEAQVPPPSFWSRWGRPMVKCSHSHTCPGWGCCGGALLSKDEGPASSQWSQMDTVRNSVQCWPVQRWQCQSCSLKHGIKEQLLQKKWKGLHSWFLTLPSLVAYSGQYVL